MKRLLNFALVLVALSSCTSKTLVLECKVDSDPKTPLILKMGEISDTLVLNEKGFYQTEFLIEKPTYAYLLQDRKRIDLYLDLSGLLRIEYDYAEKDINPKFRGDNEITCQYLYESNKIHVPYDAVKESEKSYLTAVDSVLKVKTELLDKYILKPAFIKLEKERIKYVLANNVLRYAMIQPYLTKQDYSMSQEALKYIDLSFDNVELFSHSDFKMFINLYYDVIYFSSRKPYNSLLKTNEVFEDILVRINEKSIKEYVLYEQMRRFILKNGIENADELIKTFKDNVTNAEYLKKTNESIENCKMTMVGQKSPDFKLQDINGKWYSLKDFAGKYIYIDIWATWCGPCKGELPHLAKLEEEFHGKNIVFVSMSVDKNKAAWEKMVNDKKLGGVQLHAGENCDFINKYRVNGIPRFLLLDREGKILDPEAPRPSGDIKNIINALKGL